MPPCRLLFSLCFAILTFTPPLFMMPMPLITGISWPYWFDIRCSIRPRYASGIAAAATPALPHFAACCLLHIRLFFIAILIYRQHTSYFRVSLQRYYYHSSHCYTPFRRSMNTPMISTLIFTLYAIPVVITLLRFRFNVCQYIYDSHYVYVAYAMI